MPMTAVYPRPDNETNSWARHRKAYPNGIAEYRIPIVIQGGAYPFKYEILDAPTGMTIGSTIADKDYGILSWRPSSPSADKNVTIRVSDQERNSILVSWSVSATTAGFIFVDATTPISGDGSIASPLKLFSDLHNNSDTDTQYSGYIVYFRAGTHLLTGPAAKGNLELNANRKPAVWLGYTNEKVVIDYQSSKVLVGNQDDIFIAKLKFINARNDVNNAHFWFFNQNSPQKRMTFFETEFDGISRGLTGRDNPAAITFFNPGQLRYYFSLVACNIKNFSAPLVDAYAIKYGVIENNILLNNNLDASGKYQGILLKSDIQSFSVRRNTSTLSSFSYGAIEILMQSQLFTNSEIEISYNRLIDPLNSTKSTRALVYNWQTANGKNTNPQIYVYRNTILGGITGLKSFPYTVFLENNVVLSAAGLNASTANRSIIKNDNIVEDTRTTIINSNGELIAGGIQYIGTHGHEIISSEANGGNGGNDEITPQTVKWFIQFMSSRHRLTE
ncbi:hypothetical protein [sulfur-oxidizing endosymbiont of Gigantopelta aegis]|uniref:hypothetical protein n=1 Tax=sulfur-oxidizing endosymbiont of Gigantopelta aegis TaxID=2794934 RepID=UPI001BE4B9C2|nr:hypothetical protein [sulfur-oxidizing endosymbiont of Gigantopelta aegis]